MIPLCTTAIASVQSWCGCALVSFGAPWVAQRVCAIPIDPLIGDASTAVSSITILPAALRVSRPFPLSVATPAESYPRYSRRLSPSINIGAAVLDPMYPTIPHIRPFLDLACGAHCGVRVQSIYWFPCTLYQFARAPLRGSLGNHAHDGLGP